MNHSEEPDISLGTGGDAKSELWLDDVGALDIRMVMALQAILQEQNVGQVARSFGRSQPGMSNALARIRLLFKDPLLVRSKRGMRLTPRGEQLREHLSGLNTQLERLCRPLVFEPGLSKKSFQIVATDVASLTLGASLVRHVRAAAPNVEIALHARQTLAETATLHHDYSLLMGYAHSYDHAQNALELFSEDLNLICRKGLLGERESVCVDDIAQMAHIAPSADRSEFFGVVDRWLCSQGISKNVVARTSGLTLIPAIVSQSDLIALFPSSLAAVFIRDFPLQVIQVSPRPPQLAFRIEWPERLDDDPSQRWLIEAVKAASRQPALPTAT